MTLTTSPARSGCEHLDDVEGFVEHEPGRRGGTTRSSMSGAGITRILRPAVNTSTEPSSLVSEVHAERRGRLRKLLDLLGERARSFSRSARSASARFSFCDTARTELVTGREELVLEQGDLPRGVREATTKQTHLLFQVLDLAPELMDLRVEFPPTWSRCSANWSSPPPGGARILPPANRRSRGAGTFLSPTHTEVLARRHAGWVVPAVVLKSPYRDTPTALRALPPLGLSRGAGQRSGSPCARPSDDPVERCGR